MPKYFMDSEFYEDGKTIDLISIALVCEDGREYYAISTEFEPGRVSDWVYENVIKSLPERWPTGGSPAENYLANLWKSRDRIRRDILGFCNPEQYGTPEFWAWYADYDWVVFCQLFGTMMDLPKGFPMYCKDIKQFCDAMGNPRLPEQAEGEHNALFDARHNLLRYKAVKQYHDQERSHA